MPDLKHLGNIVPGLRSISANSINNKILWDFMPNDNYLPELLDTL